MKRMFTVFVGVLLLALTACGVKPAAETALETITLATRNGAAEAVEVEFPYQPQRIAVMDLAALDILDNLGLRESIVGVSKGSSIDYLQSYMEDDSLLNLGTIKEADLEALMEAEPQVIFVGGRMNKLYDELAKIAPVYMMYTDTQLGVVESTMHHTRNIAALFGVENRVDGLLTEYAQRIDDLKTAAQGERAIVGMVNAGGFSLLGNDGRCSIIGKEIGFQNVGLAEDAPSSEHGNDASFEFVLDVNPAYIFVLDRDAAIGTQGAQLAAQVMDNPLVNKTIAAQNGNVIVLAHSNIWYTAEGGITALGMMLEDLETALGKA